MGVMEHDFAAFERARADSSPQARAHLEFVRRFFESLGRLDFATAAAQFGPEGLYQDVPVPEADARGPQAIERKLQSGLSGLAGLALRFSRVVASGDCIVSEREEAWHFPSGEVARLPVLCVHELRGGKFGLWREYWNLPTLMSQMPASWIELMTARSRAQ
jgi:limonene-1,2-epoxide hydrolase